MQKLYRIQAVWFKLEVITSHTYQYDAFSIR